MPKNHYKSWVPLKVGDTVDVVAPGFATTQDKVEGALAFLDKVGLKARVPADLFGPDVICSQTDDIRLKHLRQAFQNTESKAIWCLRGGYGAIRLIEKFAQMKKPKINKLFIGYSDSTTIHNHLNQFWRHASLHGPLLDRLGQHTLPLEQVNEMMDVVFGNRTEVIFKNLKPLNLAASKKKNIKASVIGGNLKVVESSLGTKFCKNPRGQIIFFEDIGERGYRVDRMLKHLLMAGYFKNAAAILFGEFIEGKEPNGETRVDAVIERFAREVKLPVFNGIEVGHGEKQRPLPLGTACVLKCGSSGEISIATGAAQP